MHADYEAEALQLAFDKLDLNPESKYMRLFGEKEEEVQSVPEATLRAEVLCRIYRTDDPGCTQNWYAEEDEAEKIDCETREALNAEPWPAFDTADQMAVWMRRFEDTPQVQGAAEEGRSLHFI